MNQRQIIKTPSALKAARMCEGHQSFANRAQADAFALFLQTMGMAATVRNPDRSIYGNSRCTVNWRPRKEEFHMEWFTASYQKIELDVSNIEFATYKDTLNPKFGEVTQ